MQHARTSAEQHLNAAQLRSGAPKLIRSLSLTHAVLYGLGVTIGAGIYVLVGTAADRSGMQAPRDEGGSAGGQMPPPPNPSLGDPRRRP